VKHLHYSTIAAEKHTVRVSTWQQDGEWHYKFTVNGDVKDQGVLGPVDETDDEGIDELADMEASASQAVVANSIGEQSHGSLFIDDSPVADHE
jgi:hypothetical protein